jgi:diphthine synthase
MLTRRTSHYWLLVTRSGESLGHVPTSVNLAFRRATTHADMILRARALNIPTRIIHNASIMNAVGACGLALYNFGQCVSLVFFTETWKPDSFYDRIQENVNLGLHTLILLDIKVKEQSEENLAR